MNGCCVIGLQMLLMEAQLLWARFGRCALQEFQPGLPVAGHTGSSMTELSLGLQGEGVMRPCKSMREQAVAAAQPELALMITA